MFAKLKKKIAEETAVAQRPGSTTRIPRSGSKESVASMGADSGDDFASDGSSSREDLSSQLLRRNEQIRKLEARLSGMCITLLTQDYAEQVRNLQKIKEKLEIALEKHQDSSMRKFQEQNETFQANRAKMAEGLALALARKDQEWSEKMEQLEKDKRFLTSQLQEVKNQSLSLFQKRDEIDELEGFQQQEISKVKHMLDHLKASKAGAEHKVVVLEQKEQELQAAFQQLSIDLQKVTAETQEKEKVITHLQEKVIFLEKRLEQNLSGEDHVQELLKEKTVAEQNLEDTRQQLLAVRNSHTKALDLLETRVKDLEQSLQAAEEQLSQSKDVVASQEAQIQKLITTNQENSLSQQQVLALEQHCRERIHALEAQIEALEQTRVADQLAAEQGMRQLQQENVALKESRSECEHSLQHHQLELKKLKDEWSQREIVSVAMAQALEEVRKQREEFQQQATELTAIIDEKNQSLSEKDEALLQKEQELQELEKGHKDRLPLHSQEPLVISKAMQNSEYELPAAEGTPNGEVGAMDLKQLQKEKQDLEQQLTEKNKIMKQMQQRMLELKKTLQKELKIRPDSELFEVREKTGPEIPNMAPSVTNNADLTDAREINFEYLKHVVLKFMSCRESEAFHLIKAVSVLLNFSQEEENMLKETLEYKDVLVWIQTSSQGQHPAIYLQPSDTMVLDPPKDRAPWAGTLPVKRILTHQTGT
ncbi:Golgin subfamily A member 1 [Apodemus speciosus]|uniref:Golgin subfamily A member 1 n=1 Tax=Apodemus speciosus TaxID=105296 RepID=A0ABQ0EHM0_APOSI